MELASPKFIADSWNGVPDNLDAVLGLGDSGKLSFCFKSLISFLIHLLSDLLWSMSRSQIVPDCHTALQTTGSNKVLSL